MGISGIISAIVVGLIIGALGRLVAPGRQGIKIWLTIVIGIVAAFIGAAIAGALGIDQTGFSFWTLLIQIALAAVGVTVAANMLGSKGRTH